MEYGLDPDYVLDKIQTYEIKAIMDNGYLKYREKWEMTRMLAYVTAQSQSTKKLKVTDIVSFPWDKQQEKTEKEVVIDKQRIKRIKEMAKEMIKNNIV